MPRPVSPRRPGRAGAGSPAHRAGAAELAAKVPNAGAGRAKAPGTSLARRRRFAEGQTIANEFSELRALVVDDNIDAATSFSYLLQLLGCRTAVAFGGVIDRKSVV